MKYIKVFRQFNLFQPLKAKILSEVNIKSGDEIVCLNDDNSLYGVCGAVTVESANWRNRKLLTSNV